ncbi:(3R)-3-hydroxyacyl-CoA dehydrogenase-like [Dermacentor andersoni]|uniref:(3R)-3-hydroxyacyl-CoA dehydrogenase-like n=1 Tax=Dermacentor andersoni TaxID=34620 RepID=UPI0024163837|nr:(3R)-3-hydroxyacyl-CoA dehydrogenase-like [Dermacentor andersoni]
MASASACFYGRVALVTGGASGIGQAVCNTLAAGGAIVVVADKQLEAARKVALSLPVGSAMIFALVRKLCGIPSLGFVVGGDAKHQAMFVDVGESVSVEQLFDNIRSAFSEPLSIVAHCAGILRTAPLCECTDELFDDVIRGTFLVNRAAGRDMRRAGTPLAQGGAAIVNISSVAAKSCPASSAAYAAAKAGVVALTKSAASELAEHGIRCNAVLPGWVETTLMAHADAARKAKALSSTPLGRTAQPCEIAEAIKFLCSPAVSSFITGATLEVTGGFYT